MKYILMTIVVLMMYGICEAKGLYAPSNVNTREVCLNGLVYVITTARVNDQISTSIVQSYKPGRINLTRPPQPRTCNKEASE